jgi:cell division initiation protein
MKLTPMEIHQKTFTKKMFGYDEKEVSLFFTELATYLEQILHEKNILRDSLREKELRLAENKEREMTLQNTIQAATHMTEKMREDAEREAKLILNEANQRAETIVRDAKENLRKMYSEIADIKRIRMQFEASFKALVQAHLSLLEEGNNVFKTHESRSLVQENFLHSFDFETKKKNT